MKNIKIPVTRILKILLAVVPLIIAVTLAVFSADNTPPPQNTAAAASVNSQSKSVPDELPGKDVSSDSANSQESFDIKVGINYKITLDDKVKAVDTNIIKAARQEIFDYASYNAKFSHYNGYIINNDVYIFEVAETGKYTWEVRFWEKQQDSDYYNKDGYCFATVEKQKSGSFKGYIINPGGPMVRGDETY